MTFFFIAGLFYLLCFEHVDNLGAYCIPSETGLLIPSDCFSHALNWGQQYFGTKKSHTWKYVSALL
jgi:hypothetical protein